MCAADERGERLLIVGQQRRADGDFGRVVIFAVDQFQVAGDFRFEFFLGKDLDHVDVHLLGHQVAQRRLVAVLVHQVRDQNDDAAARIAKAEIFHAVD